MEENNKFREFINISINRHINENFREMKKKDIESNKEAINNGSRFSVPKTLELIKEQTGLKLELCDYFTSIKECNGRKYFNVILSQRTSESKDYETLKRFADKYKLISVEPNGLKRVAVFQNSL